MKLPPDIDRLAWTVAESGDPRLRAQFSHRHPEYVEELDRRWQLVEDRGHTPAHAAAGIALPVRRASVPLWVCILAGAALGAVVLSAMLPRRAAEVVADPITAAPRATTSEASTSVTANAANASGPQDIPPVSSAPPTKTATSSERPTTIRLEGTNLHDALALIAAAGSLTVRVDPDIPNTGVREELTDLTPREMLQRLGGEYGFRIVEESPGSLVLVPLSEQTGAGDDDGANTPEQIPTPPPGQRVPTGSTGTSDSDFPVYAGGKP